MKYYRHYKLVNIIMLCITISLLSMGCAQHRKGGTDDKANMELEENREITKAEQQIEEDQAGEEQVGEKEKGVGQGGEDLTGEVLPEEDQADEELAEELDSAEILQPKGEFLGTDYSAVDYIVMTLDEINVYYDLLQDYQMEFAINLCEAFYEGKDKLTLGEAEELSSIKEKGYVILKPSNYYLDILFTKPQTVILGDKQRYECDVIMVDLTERIIYISLEGEYKGVLYYEEDCFKDILQEVENIIDSID